MVSQYQAELPKGILSCQQHLQKLFSSKPTQLWKTTVKVDKFISQGIKHGFPYVIYLFFVFLKFFSMLTGSGFLKQTHHSSSHEWGFTPLYLDQIDGLQNGLWHILSWVSTPSGRGHANNMEHQWQGSQTHNNQKKSCFLFNCSLFFVAQSFQNLWLQRIPNHLCPTFGITISFAAHLCLNLSGKISCALDWNSLFKG